MSNPRTVVIPFGVPAEGRGLGLGIAALVHAFVHVEGQGVAIAQLHARRKEDPADSPPLPVEAFVPPEAWRDIAGRGDAPNAVTVVVTGALQPPVQGNGTLQLLAFDPRDGQTRARVDVPFDDARAGALLVGAIEQLGSRLGAEVGPLGGLRDLDWDSLVSVLYAERCALHDPVRGGPHDRLAAMAHLGRAIHDAPAARYPSERLASFAIDTLAGASLDERLASAASRALGRAVDDAPEHLELVESLAMVELRLGQPRDAECRLNAAIARSPGRARLYALLAQNLRSQNKPDAALAVLQAGHEAAGADLLLSSERGAVLAMRGDALGAASAWQEALARDPVHPETFVSLASLALRSQDVVIAASLVDAALAAPRAHPDVLRHAVKLVVAAETEGLARAARVAGLCKKLLDVAPQDAWASLALSHAHVALGETAAARERLSAIERAAPGSAPASEAQALALAIDDPALARGLESLLRAAHTAPMERLEEVAVRARKLATLHGAWPGWLAAGVAERRRGRWTAARAALEIALELAPGASGAHLELSGVLLSVGDAARSCEHAERVVALEGETPRALLARARALAAEGKRRDAQVAAARVLAMQPGNEDARELVEQLKAEPAKPGWLSAVRGWWAKT